jgi:hypothetical protein
MNAICNQMTDADTLDFNKYRSFNIEKIIQVFAYIQKHAGTEDKLEIIKYLSFADRLNLRRHFFLISMDYIMRLNWGLSLLIPFSLFP